MILKANCTKYTRIEIKNISTKSFTKSEFRKHKRLFRVYRTISIKKGNKCIDLAKKQS